MGPIGDGRRVDQHVDGAVVDDELLDHGDDAGLIGNVDGRRLRPTALRPDSCGHCRRRVDVAVGHDHECALAGHGLGGGPTDTRGAPRDHGDQGLQAPWARHAVGTGCGLSRLRWW